ncbi:hypothetical protein LCGC14_3115680, partial [marine sediment metagenome]
LFILLPPVLVDYSLRTCSHLSSKADYVKMSLNQFAFSIDKELSFNKLSLELEPSKTTLTNVEILVEFVLKEALKSL